MSPTNGGVGVLYPTAFLMSSIFSRKSLPFFKQEGWKGGSSFPYLEALIILSLTVYVLEFYLDLRQLKRLRERKPPSTLVTTLKRIDDSSTEDKDAQPAAETLVSKANSKFDKTQSYGRDKLRFGIFSGALHLLLELTTLVAGLQPWMWSKSNALNNEYFGQDFSVSSLRVSLIFLALTTVYDEIIGLPFSLYSTFVLEHRHGFNKQTLKLFVTDKIKGLVLSAVIGAPLMTAVLWLIGRGGQYLFAYLWALLFAVSILAMTLYPTVIAPMFNQYTPLEEGPLREAIEALASRVHYPLKQLYVVDGSTRSAHSNAYMYGFGSNKRIVLFDTLLKQVKQDELVAILGHELGHWEMGHTLRNFAVTQVYLFATLFGYGLIAEGPYAANLFSSFGFSAEQPRPPLLSLLLYFSVIMAPVEHILKFLMNAYSRRCEFQADEYAVKLGCGSSLQTGLCKLQFENLSSMNPDPLYSTYHFSHPPLAERLAAMLQAETDRSGKRKAA